MRKITLPGPPQPSFDRAALPEQRDATSRRVWRAPPPSPQIAPLDAAFLERTYLTTLWLGWLLTWCALELSHSYLFAGSFLGGIALGGLLLKSQEILVRRVLRGKHDPPATGLGTGIPLFVLLPGKYLAIAAALMLAINHHLFDPVGFVVGFVAAQVIIVGKVVGRSTASRVRPVSEVYGPRKESNVH